MEQARKTLENLVRKAAQDIKSLLLKEAESLEMWPTFKCLIHRLNARRLVPVRSDAYGGEQLQFSAGVRSGLENARRASHRLHGPCSVCARETEVFRKSDCLIFLRPLHFNNNQYKQQHPKDNQCSNSPPPHSTSTRNASAASIVTKYNISKDHPASSPPYHPAWIGSSKNISIDTERATPSPKRSNHSNSIYSKTKNS